MWAVHETVYPLLHSLGSFGKNLERVLLRGDYREKHVLNQCVRYRLMEEVEHVSDEDCRWLLPLQRLGQDTLVDVELMMLEILGDVVHPCSKALIDRCCITIRAPGRYVRTEGAG